MFLSYFGPGNRILPALLKLQQFIACHKGIRDNLGKELVYVEMESNPGTLAKSITYLKSL